MEGEEAAAATVQVSGLSHEARRFSRPKASSAVLTQTIYSNQVYASSCMGDTGRPGLKVVHKGSTSNLMRIPISWEHATMHTMYPDKRTK